MNGWLEWYYLGSRLSTSCVCESAIEVWILLDMLLPQDHNFLHKGKRKKCPYKSFWAFTWQFGILQTGPCLELLPLSVLSVSHIPPHSTTDSVTAGSSLLTPLLLLETSHHGFRSQLIKTISKIIWKLDLYFCTHRHKSAELPTYIRCSVKDPKWPTILF